MPGRVGALVAGACLVCACDPPRGGTTDAGQAEAAPPPVTAAPAPSSATTPTPKPPLEILKLTLTSAVENKEPVDVLTKATAGKRVWAHLKVRNRSGRPRSVRVVFSVGGKERSSTRLDVEESWSFRTWGYVTLQATDRAGELSVTILDDMDATVGEASLPIR